MCLAYPIISLLPIVQRPTCSADLCKSRQGPLPSSSNRRPPTAISISISISIFVDIDSAHAKQPPFDFPRKSKTERTFDYPCFRSSSCTVFPLSVPGRWPCTLSRFQHRSAPTSLRRCSALDGFHHHPSTTHKPASSPGPSPTTATIPSVLAPPTLLHTPTGQNDTQPARPQLALSVGGTASAAYHPTRRALPLLVVGLSIDRPDKGTTPSTPSAHLVRHRLPLSCRVISPSVGSLGSLARHIHSHALEHCALGHITCAQGRLIRRPLRLFCSI